MEWRGREGEMGWKEIKYRGGQSRYPGDMREEGGQFETDMWRDEEEELEQRKK